MSQISDLEILSKQSLFYRTNIETLKKLHTLKQHLSMLSGKKKKKRLREITTLEENGKFVKDDYKKYLANQIGNEATILIEKTDKNFSYGKSQHFTKIKINDKIKEGKLVNCTIIDFKKDTLSGKVI